MVTKVNGVNDERRPMIRDSQVVAIERVWSSHKGAGSIQFQTVNHAKFASRSTYGHPLSMDLIFLTMETFMGKSLSMRLVKGCPIMGSAHTWIPKSCVHQALLFWESRPSVSQSEMQANPLMVQIANEKRRFQMFSFGLFLFVLRCRL